MLVGWLFPFSFSFFLVRIVLEFIYFLNYKIKDLINHFKLYYTFYFGIVPIVLLSGLAVEVESDLKFSSLKIISQSLTLYV
jgi:hypothetical protein